MKEMKSLVLISFVICTMSACNSQSTHSESPGTKHEWSILQGVEDQNRASVPNAPEFKTIEGYELLSLPDKTGSQRIWIMLWPRSVPYYKQMPNEDYSIPNALVDDLAKARRISPSVEEVLRTHQATSFK
jgi:hypothetical protein